MSEDNEIVVFINNAGYTEEEQKQLLGSIDAFKNGKEQPKGRFIILGTLPKEDHL